VGRVPSGFDAWFARACARELGERFQSARNLATELRRVCGTTGGDSRDAAFGSGSNPAPTANGATPYAAPTANTYATSVGLEKPRAPVGALLIGGLVAVATVAGVAAFVTKQRSDTPAAESSTSEEPSADSRAVGAAPVATPATPVEVTPVPAVVPDAAAPPPASASGVPAVVANPKVAAGARRPPREPAVTGKEKSGLAASASAKPPPVPTPKTPKDVNLGI
jgi:serine/threonine-protein kinase